MDAIALSRRAFFVGASAVALSGCVGVTPLAPPVATVRFPVDPYYSAMYAAIDDEVYPVPAVNLAEIDPAYLRKVVDYRGREAAGSIVIDPNERYLYLVGDEGRAIRYGVGVGREGFGWAGNATIRRKAEWPTWTPPAEMIKRKPELEEFADGMPGGLANPLGARALYLYEGDRDTLYRIHGTNEPWTVGSRASSGCIRMINHDVIDLYRRVPSNTRVAVLGSRVADGERIVGRRPS